MTPLDLVDLVLDILELALDAIWWSVEGRTSVLFAFCVLVLAFALLGYVLFRPA